MNSIKHVIMCIKVLNFIKTNYVMADNRCDSLSDVFCQISYKIWTGRSIKSLTKKRYHQPNFVDIED